MPPLNVFPQPAAEMDDDAKMAATVQRIMSLTQMSANALLQGYRQSRLTIYENPFGLTADAIYTALGKETAAQLGQMAVLTKTVINAVQPGKVVDEVPVATLTLPTTPPGPYQPEPTVPRPQPTFTVPESSDGGGA